MSRIRRGWELTKKSWALLREHPALIRFPLYGAAATIICAVIVLGPGIYLISDDKAAAGAPLGGDRLLPAGPARHLLQRRPRRRCRHDLPGPGGRRRRGSRRGPFALRPDRRLGGGLDDRRPGSQRAGERGRDLRADLRPAARHRLVADHLPGGPGDRPRGDGAAGDAEALRRALPGPLGTADHRQRRDRRRRLPARRAARRDPRRRRARGLVAEQLRRRPAAGRSGRS